MATATLNETTVTTLNSVTLTLTPREAATLKYLLGAAIVGHADGPRGDMNNIYDAMYEVPSVHLSMRAQDERYLVLEPSAEWVAYSDGPMTL